MSAQPAARDSYRRVLLELAHADPRIFCVDSDMGGLETTFGAELPGQYVNVGIAEANMMGICAGLAAGGLIPFANTMSGFAVWRAGEQLRADIVGSGLPVRVVVTHAGLSAGHYGPSHHAVEDLAITRSLPRLTVVAPADAAQAEAAVRAVAYLPGPVFLRLGRSATPPLPAGAPAFVLGAAQQLANGDDVAIVATGPRPVGSALRAAAALAAEGIAARVLNMHTVQPLDRDAVLSAARQTRGIVTVEDHVVAGGLGGAVCETVCEAHPCPVLRIGVRSPVDAVGDEEQLLAAAGITAEKVAAAARRLLSTTARTPVPGEENGHDASTLPHL
jgi:transketolase